jgi:N-acetylneuraminic acid mutarotase
MDAARTQAILLLSLGISACGSSSQAGDDSSAGGAAVAGAAGTGGSALGGMPSAGMSGSAAASGGTSGGSAGAGGGDAGSGGSTAGAGGKANQAGAGGTEIEAGAAGASSGTGGGGLGGAGSGGGSGAGGTGGAPVIEGTPTEQGLAPLLAERQEHSVVALAGEIYVVGGYVSGSISTSVQAYDPGTDEWRDVKDFPGPLQHSNAGVVGDKLYVAGFYLTTGTTMTSAQTFEYDPGTDEWTEKRPLPGLGRAAGCTAVEGGLFYVFGGALDGTSVAEAARYDPANDAWEALPDLPGPREHCTAGAIDGTLYFVGGRVDEIVNIEPDVWAFDPTAKTWTPKAPLLRPRAGLAGSVLFGKLYTFGGEGNPESNMGIFDDIDVYDPVLDAWEALPPMLVPRHGFGAATLADRIYLAGGAIRQGGAPSDENSVFYLE